MRSLGLILGVAVTTLAALVAGGVSDATSAAGQPRIVVTRTQAGLPAGCRPADAARLLHQAFAAFSHHRTEAFVRHFVSPSVRNAERFRWFFISDGFANVHALTAAALRRYARLRAPLHDRILLRQIDIGVDRVLGTAGFAFVAQRAADDRPVAAGGSAGILEGKGEYDCDAQTIHVFSASMEEAPGRRYPHPFGRKGPCPLPRGWTPELPYIVACVRGDR